MKKRVLSIFVICMVVLTGCSITINTSETTGESTQEPMPVMLVTPTPKIIPTPVVTKKPTIAPQPTSTLSKEQQELENLYGTPPDGFEWTKEGSLAPISTTSINEYPIEILNGSAIDGLGSRYQKELMQDGFWVANIGNYTGMKQERTIIYCRDKKWVRKHLKKYLPFAKIKFPWDVKISDNIVVQIILGVDADKVFEIEE